MFTSKIDAQICIEGAKMQVACSVYADDINVKWFKEGREIHNCKNILKTRNGNQRKLIVKNVSVSALKKYSVRAENVQIDFPVTVKGKSNLYHDPNVSTVYRPCGTEVNIVL